MRIKVLGCSGGIGGDLRTTSMLVDEDILIDAGTGVSDLSIEQLVKIDHVFVTHSHLDHVTSIPFLVDTVCWMRDRPITVYSTGGDDSDPQGSPFSTGRFGPISPKFQW